MRPIHLGLAVLFLVAALAGLWFALDLSPGTARAGSTGEETSAGNEAGAALSGGSGDGSERGPDPEASRSALSAAEIEERPAVLAGVKVLPLFSGRLVDAQGKGIAGATVFASTGRFWVQIPLDVEPDGLPTSWLRVERTSTDAEGRFSFDVLPPGRLRVAARAAGFAPRYVDHLELPARPEYALPDIRMEAGVVLTGKVVDAEGAGIEGAALLLALDGGPSAPGAGIALPGRGIPLATTGASGEFRIDQIAAGPWKLIVEAPGHAIVEQEGRTEKPGEQQTGLVFRLEPGYEILGRVHAEFGALPEGLRIGARPSPEPDAGAGAPGFESMTEFGMENPDTRSAADTRSRYAVCGPDGSFVVRGLTNGVRYRMTLSRKSGEAGGWRRVRGGEPIFAWAGQRGVEIAYKPEAALVFRVVDGRTRAPLREFSVWAGEKREQPLRDEDHRVVHEFPDGRVRFGDLRPKRGAGGVSLRVAANGYKDLERKGLALEPGQELDLGELALEASPLFLARVVDDESGAPIEGARVFLGTKSDEDLVQLLASPPEEDFFGEADVRYARTDVGGRARLSSFPEATATVCASARGFLPSELRRVPPSEDRDEEMELRLKHGGTVTVLVRDAQGRPVQGVGVEHKRPSGGGEEEDPEAARDSKKTEANGAAVFDALVPGAHAFRVNDRTADAEWYEMEGEETGGSWTEAVVAEGSRATLEFVAPPRGGLHGRVREGGKPLEGARLHLVEVREGSEESYGWFAPGNDPFQQITDHGGRYDFEGLRCASYRLLVSHASRRMPALFDVEIQNPAGAFDIDLDVASIEGRVTGEDGRPLAGIEVEARATEEEIADEGDWRMVITEDDRGTPRVAYRQETRPATKTDANGSYVLRGVRTGVSLTLTASGDMVVVEVAEGITVGPDEARRGVDFSLQAAGIIEVTLAGAAPRSGPARVWYRVLATRAAESEGSEEGLYGGFLGDWNRVCRLTSLPPGEYSVAFELGSQEVDEGSGEPTEEAGERQQVLVVAGQVNRITFQPKR